MNAVAICEAVEERYRQYLEATFHFRDQELREAFHEALRGSDLRQGPYLEATPVFLRGNTLTNLAHEVVGPGVDEGFLRALDGQRPLYAHQEQAIRAVLAGRNVAVTTGTGSGKTESFLYPILLALYQEHLRGVRDQGVRALVLYPMNALVNDQRERLGKIAAAVEQSGDGFRFTFGQYVGATPEDEADHRRKADDRQRERLHGELVLRSEMRAAPPDILLTNYSMLEYLLLRPQDSPLFDGGRARNWQFLVLDEAHQYRGAKGIEMAMLLRRLKERLREGGRQGPFRCIATSATIAGGRAELGEVAKFASALFGEPLGESDIVMGTTVAMEPPADARPVAPQDYARLAAAVASEESATGDPDAVLAISETLSRDPRCAQLRAVLAHGPMHLAEAADAVFPDMAADTRPDTLRQLVDLMVRTKDRNGIPALSARYHFFLRSLEGAFVSFGSQSVRLTLNRGDWAEDRTGFEVALCRECGAHYLVGAVRNGQLQEAVRDPSSEDFGVSFFRQVSPDDPVDDRQRHILCVQCGGIRRWRGAHDLPPCGHKTWILVDEQAASHTHDDQVSECRVCGYSARDPVQEVVHGTDGPHAVIATTLRRELPSDRHKVLAFADSRQEAAFFAWYLDKSYQEIVARNLILGALAQTQALTSTGLSLREIADTVLATKQERHLLRMSVGEIQARRDAWHAAYREFLTEQRRLSLEGIGLVRWRPLHVLLDGIVDCLPWASWPLHMTRAQTCDMLIHLLSTLRQDGAVDLIAQPGVKVEWDALGLSKRQRTVRLGSSDSRRGVNSWDTTLGRRHRLLAGIGRRGGLGPEEAVTWAETVLCAVWQELLTQARRDNVPILSASERGSRRLNPELWRAELVRPDEQLFRCNVCGRFEHFRGTGACLRPECRGELEATSLASLPPTHYRRLYTEELPGSLRVEEHTAQIERDKAQEFQSEFKAGRIDVLSCSTTFEMGVDLGDLDTVFLRNVPPEAFNYAQRVGRAGRRTGAVGLAITYCRRSPHDLYHFDHPERVIAGGIAPPSLALRNPKIILRHMVAAVLSDFLRSHPERGQKVEGLAGDLLSPDFRERLLTHLHDHGGDLAPLLRRIVPQNAWGDVGLDGERWLELIAGPASRVADVQVELRDDVRNVVAIESERSRQREYDKANWAKRRRNDIAQEDVFAFLSRKAVIPKYGFPVDVVELDTTTARSQRQTAVTLQRDLAQAIAEFAPQSHVIANKLEWVSAGLKLVAERGWQWKRYWRCPVHNRVETVDRGGDLAPKCCNRALEGEYIEPRFGFLVSNEPPKEPHRRVSRLYTTRPHFLGWTGQGQAALEHGPVWMRPASPGKLVVLSEGQRGARFRICPECGAGLEPGQAARWEHKTPFGSACRGTPAWVSLGYELVTDAVELQFSLPLPAECVLEPGPAAVAHSLAFALMEGLASVVDVPSRDLGATVTAAGASGIPALILYDDVPGGAGLVASLENRRLLRLCLEAARERISGSCGCGERESCYGCLRTYRNQFLHTQLQRGPAFHYLQRVLREM